MKRLYFVISIFLIFAFSLNAHATVKIDGTDDGLEWQNAEYIMLINEVGSNNVDFGFAKTLVSSEYEIDYFLFLSDRISGSYGNAGFILTVNDSLEINVSSSGIQVQGDPDLYHVDAKMSVDEHDGAACEISVAFKRGLPEKISTKACLIDGNGNHSYHYPIICVNPFYVEETVMTTSDITKQPVTSMLSEKKTERVTKEIKNSDLTEATAERSKTTKKTDNKTVVYFYEKEIIVSQVYESDNTVSLIDNFSDNLATAADVQTLSKGLKIQQLICIAGGAVLLGIGAWASLSGKKKKPIDNQETEKSENDNDQ